MRPRHLVLAVLFLLTSASCGDDGPSGPGDNGDGPARGAVHAVFIGNSLTYTNRVPDLVRTIAEVAGEDLSATTVAYPNVSLENHWYGGTAEQVIRNEAPDVVVMQQGPSSLPQNQVHLREWAGRFAEVAREVGGEPGLYMDGFHPSQKGAAVAALTIFRVLFDRPVTDLPPKLVPTTPGLPEIILDPAEAQLFYEGIEEAVAAYGRF